MKKLIVLSVVFALVASTAFAVDIGANVFGLVTPVQGGFGKDTNGTDLSSDITSSGGFQRARISGSGDVADGAFGGWFRYDLGGGFGAYAFWKPIDQVKVLIGGNPDGMYGKEGVTGWMLHENPYDGGVAIFGGNVWGGGMQSSIKTRDVFFGGYGGNALHVNVAPVEIFTFNLVLPFWGNSWDAGNEISDVLPNVKAQLDFNLEFGNIALTYDGDGDGGKVFLYFGGPIGPLGLDVGVSYGLNDSKIGAGLGLKFATDTFGIKFRLVTTIDGSDLNLLGELVPYLTFSDKLAVFLGIGVAYAGAGYEFTDYGTTGNPKRHTDNGTIDFYVNPYLRIGEEWGAQFLVGFQLYSKQGLGGDYSSINWALPIAIMVSF